ncbi:GNAT family N-acetyltransferase [Niveibacterium sp. 24ML]|uniref:bifunctional acetate--CoA ligase family protein/GNAT family N-acetyltransferase n=1 Tax=Niveibacterium sp. 24ML TaxID=2985512 RepID=UPI002271E7A2|nr:GNAT family N-acetyltransferase [Niveibacterium sp. 24ML]MCX9156585.1 GNAT family N-acetyltransferase [Niveibacterium sp. 24ML]
MDEQHYLTPLFVPQVVAVIGASPRDGALGNVLVQNMLESGFKGKLYSVNPKYKEVLGTPCVHSIGDVPQRVDLAIVATPAPTVPDIVAACGRARVKTAVILSAGFAESGSEGAAMERDIVRLADKYGIRILGPNSLGIARAIAGVNATFAHAAPKAGSIGFISQSGALCAAILDWAKTTNVGFSNVVSLGGSCDLDFGEILDYLIWDFRTESILLYIEGIRDARRFMSSLRTAARAKPIMVIKVGRHPSGSRAAHSHTGAIVGEDIVFDAALRRAGVIRLKYLTQMFAATQALFTRFRPRGNRLAIITNGGGPGVMAADRAGDLGIPLAELSPQTIAALNRDLPRAWSHDNPIDMVGDADPDRYARTLETVLADPGVDGILAILTPQAMTRPMEVAQRVIEIDKKADKPILCCWMGEAQVSAAREQFVANGIPSYRTPEPAIDLFSQISAYYQNQKLLTQVPSPLSSLEAPDIAAARAVIENAIESGRTTLTRSEARSVLAAFKIPVRRTLVAHTAAQAVTMAYELGFPVTMRANTLRRQSLGTGPKRYPSSAVAAHLAFEELMDDLRSRDDDSAEHGVTIEPRIELASARGLLLGVSRDPVFGPIISFGEHGVDADGLDSRTVALPPLNEFLARDLVRSHRMANKLDAWRGLPPIAMDRLEFVVLRLSEMACELPWVRSVDIQPLVADENDVVAVDVRIVVGRVPKNANRYDHMAIHPYPGNLVRHISLRDGSEVLVRPIMPEDAALEQAFVRRLSPETKYYRFMSALSELPPQMLAKLTQIDYDREMAFVATVMRDGAEHQLGVCRYAANPDGKSCEFAIVVSDDVKGTGLAHSLMEILILSAKDRGLLEMKGIFLNDNDRMLRFVRKFGFKLTNDPEDTSLKLGTLDIQAYAPLGVRE